MSKLLDELIEKEYEIVEKQMELKRSHEISEYKEAEAFQLCMDYGIPCEYGICDDCAINNSIIKEVEEVNE